MRRRRPRLPHARLYTNKQTNHQQPIHHTHLRLRNRKLPVLRTKPPQRMRHGNTQRPQSVRLPSIHGSILTHHLRHIRMVSMAIPHKPGTRTTTQHTLQPHKPAQTEHTQPRRSTRKTQTHRKPKSGIHATTLPNSKRKTKTTQGRTPKPRTKPRKHIPIHARPPHHGQHSHGTHEPCMHHTETSSRTRNTPKRTTRTTTRQRTRKLPTLVRTYRPNATTKLRIQNSTTIPTSETTRAKAHTTHTTSNTTNNATNNATSNTTSNATSNTTSERQQHLTTTKPTNPATPHQQCSKYKTPS